MPTKKKVTKEESNLAVVKGFFNELLTKKDPAGVAAYLSDDFVSHNPEIPGKQGLMDFAAYTAKELPNANIIEVLLTFSHNDLVVQYYTFADEPSKGVDRYISDYFRIKDGLIVEYWDCIKEVGK